MQGVANLVVFCMRQLQAEDMQPHDRPLGSIYRRTKGDDIVLTSLKCLGSGHRSNVHVFGGVWEVCE